MWPIRCSSRVQSGFSPDPLKIFPEKFRQRPPLSNRVRLFDLAAIGVFVLAGTASAQVAILQIRVVEGEGAVHAPGSRSIRPLTVEITDETGKPVDQAAVSFHLPDDGPGGVFLSGLRTEVVMTGADGRASIRGLQWNSTPGRLQIRIVASREQARAGMIS